MTSKSSLQCLLALGLASILTGCQTQHSAQPRGKVIATTLRSSPISSPVNRTPDPFRDTAIGGPLKVTSATSKFYGTFPYDPTKRLYVKLDWLVSQAALIPNTWTDVSKNVEMLIAARLEKDLDETTETNPLTAADLRRTVLGPTGNARCVKEILAEYGVIIFSEKFTITEVQDVATRR